MNSKKLVSKIASVGALVMACGLAQAQTTINFEPPLYAPGIVTGQQGWYIPSVGGTDGSIFTFASNPYGITAPPGGSGGLQFEAGQCTGGGTFVRAQHGVAFGNPNGVFQVSIDCLGVWDATSTNATALDNLGSFSYQDSTLCRYYQTLLNWGSGAVVINTYPGGPALANYATTKDKFHVCMGIFTNASPLGIAFHTPTAAWADRPVNHWYRTTIKWDFQSSAVLKVAITDMTLGTPVEETDVSNRGWFLRGGQNSTYPNPTDFRLFTGSAATGNVAAWDNYTYGPALADTGACCLAAGGCQILTSIACLGGGGAYAGDNSTCAQAACPAPGACCLPNGFCVTATSASCTSQAGLFRGDNTVCVDASCTIFQYDADLTADVGDLPGTAAQITGRGTPITRILGNMDLDDADMYKIQICNEIGFSATTIGGTSTAVDTMLWIFNTAGVGITMDDDTSPTSAQYSTVGSSFITANGFYYMAVSSFNNTSLVGHVPQDATFQRLWLDANLATQEWQPNGPGAANAVASWVNATANTGLYSITMTGVCSLGCYANCDQSTSVPVLTANDFQCFLNAYAAKEGYANCDGSSSSPVLTANDFQCFLNAYAAGCLP